MKAVDSEKIDAVRFDNDMAKGVTGRILIGKDDGAENFCMRLFELDLGGHSPKHSHDWEHEIFVHSGQGEVYLKDHWAPVAREPLFSFPGMWSIRYETAEAAS